MTPAESLSLLPHQSGVYRFLNREGEVIYVGKAKDLRKRVSQYFHGGREHSLKTRHLVQQIHRIEHTVVANESDALLLENNLIKTLQPKYNILLKDDKTYPWIVVKQEPFPRVFLTRRLVRDGSKYYGPYTSSYFAKQLLELIHRLYPLRTCHFGLAAPEIARGKYQECLKFHIHRCPAPCTGRITEEDYNTWIAAVHKILKGDLNQVRDLARQQMMAAAADLRFEEAQQYKQQLEALEQYQSKSVIVNPSLTNIDVCTLLIEEGRAFANFLRIVQGAVVQAQNTRFKLGIEESPEDLLSTFLAEMHRQRGGLSPEVLVPFAPSFCPPGVQARVPLKGEKKALLDLSFRNAKAWRAECDKQQAKTDPEARTRQLMEQMRKDLGLGSAPLHIECFDNSNIQGTHPVASCVVFREGRPSKKDYRHFNIKTVVGPDDFASMEEVVGRRYARLIAEAGGLEAARLPSSPLPQLVVIDGGKGQLSSAYQIIENLGLGGRITLVGLAKRLEEIFRPGDPNPLCLDKNSPTLKVLMQIRNEAHRFGITFHRQKRSQNFAKSALEDIPGIGPATSRKLLTAFKSLKRLQEAGPEAWEAAAGKKIARLLASHFQNNQASVK